MVYIEKNKRYSPEGDTASAVLEHEYKDSLKLFRDNEKHIKITVLINRKTHRIRQ